MSLSQSIVVAALAWQLSLVALVAHAEVNIDRATFFAKCGELVKTKKSFQAMDRGKLTTFYLRVTVISGDGKANIERINVGKALGLNPKTALYDNPDLALDPDYAVRILVEGMYRGLFTPRRKRLDDYFNATIEDWDGARQIVNPGSRRAPVTAGYGSLFWECLTGNTQRAPADRRPSASLQRTGG